MGTSSTAKKRRWKLRSLPYRNTKFGELWSTNGENGTFFNPFEINFSDAHISVAKGRCLLKISQLVEGGWPTLVNAHLTGDGSAPDIFNEWNSKIGQNLLYFNLYRRDLLGELHQIFLLDVSPYRTIKCLHLILGVFFLKNVGDEKRSFQLRHLRLYCKYLQIGTRFRRLENGVANRVYYLRIHWSSRLSGAFNKSYTQKNIVTQNALKKVSKRFTP